MSTETGLLLPSDHQASNEILKQSVYRAETIRLSFASDTHKIYSKLYHGPSYGIGIYSGTFYNKNIGDPRALFVFIKTPLIRKSSWMLYSEIGSGIAGNFNPYHEKLNPDNSMIGSPINMVGHLVIGFEYAITKPIKIGITAGYKHFSNGFVKSPNYGINILPVTIIGSYNFDKNNTVITNKDIQPFIPHNRFTIFIGPGTKNFGNKEKNYFVSTLGVQYIRQFNYKIGVGGGLDLFYKDSGKDKVINNKNDFINSLSTGLNSSVEWIFTEKFRINIGAGIYLFRHKENDELSFFYERFSGRYNLTKNIYAGVGVKVNNNASDYIEWTLGYVFTNDRNTY